jgi:long-chain fatty acid transport protein
MTNDRMTWGFGVFSQGGMGTEFSASSMLGAGTGDGARSELGVGRVIFPLAYRINDKFTVGGSVDFVWAGLDMKMAASTTQLGQMVSQTNPGTMGAQLGGFAGQLSATTARLDFSDDSTFSGAAKANGWGAKVGMTYLLTDSMRVGASYHGKTALSDMKTGASSTAFSFYDQTGNQVYSENGSMTVHNFQWPAETAIGVEWKATPQLTVVADLKHIAWSDVMDSFNMTYISAGQMMAGADANFAIAQGWKDQSVTMLGMAYQVNEQTVLRAGLNMASNPVPATMTHPLFPAIVKNHYTLGFGHQIDKASSIDVSATIAPQVTAAQSGYTMGPTTHSQTNFQLMYSYRY